MCSTQKKFVKLLIVQKCVDFTEFLRNILKRANVFKHAKFFIRFWFADYSTTKEMLFVLSKQRYLDRFLSLKIQMRCIHDFFCIKICINIQWCQLTLLYIFRTYNGDVSQNLNVWVKFANFWSCKKIWQKFEKNNYSWQHWNICRTDHS